MSHHILITYVLRKQRPMTTDELAAECEISLTSARQSVNYLHREKRVHISAWVKTDKGQWAGVWSIGAGEDVRKPARKKVKQPSTYVRRLHPVAEKIGALSADFRNPFATAMWNVAQGARG